jgi:phosphoribosylformylglycinamidine (FGAM) synthase PurS component
VQFLHRLLLNPQSEEMHVNAPPVIVPHVCCINIRMRPGHLDLEREYILGYCRHITTEDVQIADIKPVQRIYLLGDRIPDMPRILRHLVNPVIHEWEVVYA